MLKNEIHSEKRVLVVTDAIFSGSSIMGIITALKKQGMAFDVATLGSNSGIKEWIESFSSGKVFVGFKDHVPLVYEQREMSGVRKTTGDLHSESYVKMTENSQGQKVVDYTREQIDELAGDLITELLPKL